MEPGHSESQEFKVKGHVFAFLSVLSRPIIVMDFLSNFDRVDSESLYLSCCIVSIYLLVWVLGYNLLKVEQ